MTSTGISKWVLVLLVLLNGACVQGANINVYYEDIILAAASKLFPKEIDVEGFDIYHQELDREKNETKYVNKKYPSKFYTRKSIDGMKGFVILQKWENKLTSMDSSSYVLFRQTPGHPKHYTGHLAHVRRNAQDEPQVEWDVLSYEDEASVQYMHFAASFLPKQFGFHSNASQVMVIACKDAVTGETENTLCKARPLKPAEEDVYEKSSEEDEDGITIPPEFLNSNKSSRRRAGKNNLDNSTSEGKSADSINDENLVDTDNKSNQTKEALFIQAEHLYFEDKSTPYTGILDCNFTKVDVNELSSMKPTTRIELVVFLLKTLRAQCYDKMKENTINLFHSGLVSINDDLEITLNLKHSLFQTQLLNREQWMQVNSAIYLTTYTNAFLEQAKRKTEYRPIYLSPDGENISNSVATYTLLILRTIEILGEDDADTHVFKIRKSVLQSLDERHLHSKWEAQYLKKYCDDCSEEKNANHQDRIQLKALKEFFIFGQIYSANKKGIEMKKAFKRFYEARLRVITSKISSHI